MADNPSRTIDRPTTDAPTGGSPSDGQPNGSPPNGNRPKLSYRDLAWWAEAADGLRDKDLVIAKVEEDGEIKLRVKQKDEVRKENIVIDGIRTQYEFVPKLPITKVMVEVDGKGPMVACKADDGTVCDAIFCSESSIQKFLLLYYNAQRILNDDQWDDLYAALDDSEVIVIGHVWPSSKVAVHKPDEGEEQEAEPAAAGAKDNFYVLRSGLGVRGGAAWQGLSEYHVSRLAAAP
jgi:hypothetical protein